MNTVDTIAAVATAPGGAIGIVRISGEHALAAAQAVWRGKNFLCHANARMMLYGLIGKNFCLILTITIKNAKKD